MPESPLRIVRMWPLFAVMFGIWLLVCISILGSRFLAPAPSSRADLGDPAGYLRANAYPVHIWATDALEIRTRAAPHVPLLLPHTLLDVHTQHLPLHTPCTAAVPVGWKVLCLLAGLGGNMMLGMYLTFLA
jgi:hypothetical protein